MTDINKTAKELKAELDKSIGLLQTLHDEVKVRIHLAGMSAKDQWRALEPRLHSAMERAAREVSDASHQAVTEATEALKKFKSSISS